MTGGADTYHGYGQAWANVSNTPFRMYKHWVHEGGMVVYDNMTFVNSAICDDSYQVKHQPRVLRLEL